MNESTNHSFNQLLFSNSFQAELNRLKGQIATLQRDLALAKQTGDAEVVARVELESLVAVNEWINKWMSELML